MSHWHNLWFSGETSPGFTQELNRWQWRGMLKNIPVAASGMILTAILIVLFCWPLGQQELLLFWLGIVFCVALLRLSIWWRYRNYDKPPEPGEFPFGLFTFVSLLSGAVWGGIAVIWFNGAPLEHQLLFILISGGMAAAAVATSHAIPAACYAHILAAMVPIIVVMMTSKTDLYRYTVAMVLFFLAVMLVYARNSFMSIVDTVRLRVESIDLEMQTTQAAQSRTLFLMHMSQELRSQLTAIEGFAEVIKVDSELIDKTSVSREYAGYIQDSTHRLLALINDVLDLSSLETGLLRLQLSPVDVDVLIAETCNALMARAALAGVRLSYISQGRHQINADPILLRRALAHVIENGLKYTAPGGNVEVGVTQSPSGSISIYVRDNGIGIANSDIPLIVEPFRRIEPPVTFSQGRPGLGLPLVHKLLDLHGGKLEIKSHIAQGTLVELHLSATL